MIDARQMRLALEVQHVVEFAHTILGQPLAAADTVQAGILHALEGATHGCLVLLRLRSPAGATALLDALLGAGPLAFRPCNWPPCQINAKASPPMPLADGSSTLSAVAVAMAASIALPPACSTCRPACAAKGCDVATMPRRA